MSELMIPEARPAPRRSRQARVVYCWAAGAPLGKPKS